MKMSLWKKHSRAEFTSRIVLSVIFIICITASALAGPSISARYVKPRGDHIKWKIKVPSPPPAAVIVTQYILPGSDILESSHPLSSYDKEKGVAKWLLSPIPSGLLKMEMKISKPIRKKGEIHGEVMFKDDSDNTTASIFMKPRTVKKAVEGC